MIANALLIRWNDGWLERTNPQSIADRGRREALLGLGAAPSIGEVDRVADGHLSVFARDRTSAAADVDPLTEDDTPYLGYRVGDSVQIPGRFNVGAETQRVIAMTCTED